MFSSSENDKIHITNCNHYISFKFHIMEQFIYHIKLTGYTAVTNVKKQSDKKPGTILKSNTRYILGETTEISRSTDN